MDPTEIQLYLEVDFGGRYRTLEYRGGGNFSGVFRARDLKRSTDVAVKILSALHHDPVAIEEFATEASLLRILASCSNVVTILDEGVQEISLTTADGRSFAFNARFIVLEYAMGTVEELLVDRQRLDWPQRLRIFRAVAKGIHQMHQRRMVNRDIKTSNALLFDIEPLVKVSDLGRAADTSKPRRFPSVAYEAGRGDLRFAPPELLWMQGSTDPTEHLCSDLYLLGSVLFELATGGGLTSFVVGDGTAVFAYARGLGTNELREQSFQGRIAEYREGFELAYELFTQNMPPGIRVEALRLVRQLTDPDPKRRLPRLRQNLPEQWDLQWLLRTADILIKRLEVEGRPPRRRRVRSRTR